MNKDNAYYKKNCLALTSVSFYKKLSQKEINLYLDTKEWEGLFSYIMLDLIVFKAMLLHLCINRLMVHINTNVVGLPLYETKNLLLSAGMQIFN